MLRFRSLTFAFLLTTFLLVVFNVRTYAEDEIKVYLDDKQLSFDVNPIIQDGVTLVQIKTIFEALGMQTRWNGADRSVISSKSNLVIILYIDNNVAVINGHKNELQVPPQIIDGTTVIPLRFVAEATGYDVTWDGDKNEIRINNKNVVFPDPVLNKLIRKKINKPDGDITIRDVGGITAIYDQTDGLKSLAGLENLKNLRHFQIQKADLSSPDALLPLSKLEKIEFLDLHNCNVTNIQLLANLKSLKTLNLNKNPISDVSPLKQLESLEILMFGDSAVQDISPLKKMKLEPKNDNSSNDLIVTDDNKYLKLGSGIRSIKIDGKVYSLLGFAMGTIYVDQNNNYYSSYYNDISLINDLINISYKHYKIDKSMNPFFDGILVPNNESTSYVTVDTKYSSATETYKIGEVFNKDKSQKFSFSANKNDLRGLTSVKLFDRNLLLVPVSQIMNQFNLKFKVSYDSKIQMYVYEL